LLRCHFSCNIYYNLIISHLLGGLSVFAGIKEQSQEGEDLYRRMVSDGVIKLGDKQASEVNDTIIHDIHSIYYLKYLHL